MYRPYRTFLTMVAASFLVMYVLMYAMVNVLGNVIPNINQLYMAGLMTAAMGLIELVTMRHMYGRKALNGAIVILSILVGVGSWYGIRTQFGVYDQQFLKSMIPHHASAILMCEQATLTDPEIKTLCRNIIAGQQKEIDFMQAKLGGKE